MNQNIARVGVIFLALTIALSIMGVSYGLWTKSLTVEDTVRTGEVDLEFVDAFTDDDGEVNDLNKDSQDDGGPSQGFDAWGSESSADPAASGTDPDDVELISTATTIINDDQQEVREIARPLCVQRLMEDYHGPWLRAAGIEWGELDIPLEVSDL